MKKIQYRTGDEDAGRRVDVVLAEKFPEYSRSSWQNHLKQKRVVVDKQLTDSSYKLKPNQTIEANLLEEQPSVIALNAPDIKPEIIYQDDDTIVINKPAGLITHPTDANPSEPSVAGAFVDLVDDDDVLRPGIVHRLDRDTSGVMILARNMAAKKFLQNQFQNRNVTKHYTTLVSGNIKQTVARIELPLQKSNRQPNTMVVHAGGKPAITEYSVIAHYPSATLLDVNIHTGRTHQIRAHFAHLHHPVVGDTVYGQNTRPKGLGRQFLHAHSLTITLPSKKEQTFNAPLAEDLERYLEQL